MGSNSAGTPRELTAAARDLNAEERSRAAARAMTGGVAVVAHSYGSTMAANALAERHEGVVDAFVAVGSVGIEESVGGAEGLNVPDGSA